MLALAFTFRIAAYQKFGRSRRLHLSANRSSGGRVDKWKVSV